MIGQMPNQEEELKKLLEKNIELTEEILKLTKSIKHFITFQKFMSFVYLLIIVVPIVLSIIYLPPLLGGVFKQYQELLGVGSPAGVTDLFKGGIPSLDNLNLKGIDLKNIDPNNLPTKK
jgi:hypothetical protein